MIINNNISATIASYESDIIKIKKLLSKLPGDCIFPRKRKGHFLYYKAYKDSQGKWNEEYLPASQADFIAGCCEAKYLRKLLKALEKELSALRSFEKMYNPKAKIDAWHKLPDGYKQYAKQLYFSNEELCRKWEYSEFEANSFTISGNAQYITKKNEIVRSRIELIIANILYDLGIPYRYECRLDLPSGVLYPDFTIMHPVTLELYYVEVFGMMDNPEYEQAAFSKIAKYAASDFYSHLIMFFDHKNAPISPAAIKNTFEKVFIASA